MAPLVLQGDTLGQRHQHYNNIVKTACASPMTLESINYDEPDISNMLKIDIACAARNLPYILEILTCDDMLYVSRAIKQSTWLITEDQYKHIINPEYLNKQLFPKMMIKAQNKLLLAIRLKLNNEQRADEFFNHFKESNYQFAQKWLPYCSSALIESEVPKRKRNISEPTKKRLCEKSFNILKIVMDNHEIIYSHKRILKSTIFKYTDDMEQLFDFLDKVHVFIIPEFGKNFTQLAMEKSPERILNNFTKYRDFVDIPTLVKYMKKEDIKDFLLKQRENDKIKCSSWVTYDNIKHFITQLPLGERFQFVKQLFIDKGENCHEDERAEPYTLLRCAPFGYTGNSEKQAYDWYRLAPFTAAFPELKKMIRMESMPAERNSILNVLLYCAGRNQQHVQTLLKFYREKHINEPFKFKIQFVNSFLSHTNAHKFDENTWNVLNDIFSSMEVYMESENNVPNCIENIIVYKLLKNEDIPEIIENKLKFSTFKRYQKKLDANEKEKVFSYLYNYSFKKLQNQQINNEADIAAAVTIIQNILKLIKDWNKNITDFPETVNRIREIVKTKKEHSWEIDLSILYNVLKSWRKHMFEESLLMYPTDDACVNALKHDPTLLKRYASDVQALFTNDKISLRKVLKKLRIYWTESLAQEWIDEYLQKLEKSNKGHKALVEGVCTLLPRKQISSIIKKYAPVETKIDWTDTDASLLNIRKNIGKNMKTVRPSLDVDTVLLYAKEDYLQYALPSLNSITYNMSPVQTLSCFENLLDAPVSLQKHGIRTAFSKLKLKEIKELIQNIWLKTKNSTIKTILFKLTHQLLCTEKNPVIISELWEMLSMYIDNLSPEESRSMLAMMAKVQKLPPAVRGQFLMKCHNFLKSLPAKSNCNRFVRKLEESAAENIDLLEPDFIENVLLKTLNEIIVTKYNNTHVYTTINIVSAYLLSSSTEESQMQKYDNVLAPTLSAIFAAWRIRIDQQNVAQSNFENLLNKLITDATKYILKKNIIVPVKLFQDIKNKVDKALTVEENYGTITTLHLLALFFEVLSDYLKNKPVEVKDDDDSFKKNQQTEKIWENICKDVAPLFGTACLKYFKNDISAKYTSLFLIASQALSNVLQRVSFNYLHKFLTLKSMLADESATICYFMVIDIVAHMSTYMDGCLELKKNIYRLIQIHSSTEVQMHFNEKSFDLDTE